MKQPVVIIGLGELGGVFAKAFLKQGHPVYPIIRGMDLTVITEAVDPVLALVAVGEGVLEDVLTTIPPDWRGKLVLLQNELLPFIWERHDIYDPTVISVWFEKKKGMDHHVLDPSPIYGPQGDLIGDAIKTLEIPVKRLSSSEELLQALVMKNVFVKTLNIAGLKVGGTTGGLLAEHHDQALQIAQEVIDVEEWLTGAVFSRDALIAGMIHGFKKAPDHKCRGRSAPDRLRRVVEFADQAGLAIPEIRRIKSDYDASKTE